MLRYTHIYINICQTPQFAGIIQYKTSTLEVVLACPVSGTQRYLYTTLRTSDLEVCVIFWYIRRVFKEYLGATVITKVN